MIEYLLIYFIDTLQDRYLAEEAILDMFVNLRYYYDKWPRAKIFSQNLEVIRFSYEETNSNPDEKTETLSETNEYGDSKKFDLPHGLKRDNVASENDIYSQEFFLYAYSILTRKKSNFEETSYGFTYMLWSDHFQLSKIIISLMRGKICNHEYWLSKMKNLIHT